MITVHLESGVLLVNMKYFSQHILSLVASLILFSSVPLLYAWTSPTATPPAGNVAAPINIGTASQNKLGALGLGGLAVFGKSLLTETNGYSLPTTKPSMLLGVNGAVGAKEYCDEKGQNCVTTLGGGGSGWVDVPLSGTENFDDQCLYRFKMQRSGRQPYVGMSPYYFPNAVASTQLTWWLDTEVTEKTWHISASSKNILRVNGTVYTDGGDVVKIEKNCGGGGASSRSGVGAGSTQIFSGWPNGIVCNATNGTKIVLRASGYYPTGRDRYSTKPGYIYGEIGGIVSIYFDATSKKSLIVHGNGDYGGNLPQAFAGCFDLGRTISDPIFTWIN